MTHNTGTKYIYIYIFALNSVKLCTTSTVSLLHSNAWCIPDPYGALPMMRSCISGASEVERRNQSRISQVVTVTVFRAHSRCSFSINFYPPLIFSRCSEIQSHRQPVCRFRSKWVQKNQRPPQRFYISLIGGLLCNNQLLLAMFRPRNDRIRTHLEVSKPSHIPVLLPYGCRTMRTLSVRHSDQRDQTMQTSVYHTKPFNVLSEFYRSLQVIM